MKIGRVRYTLFYFIMKQILLLRAREIFALFEAE